MHPSVSVSLAQLTAAVLDAAAADSTPPSTHRTPHESSIARPVTARVVPSPVDVASAATKSSAQLKLPEQTTSAHTEEQQQQQEEEGDLTHDDGSTTHSSASSRSPSPVPASKRLRRRASTVSAKSASSTGSSLALHEAAAAQTERLESPSSGSNASDDPDDRTFVESYSARKRARKPPPASNALTVIHCGVVMPNGVREYREHCPFFASVVPLGGADKTVPQPTVNVYTAVSDRHRRVLYCCGDLAKRFETTTDSKRMNKVGMWMSRRKDTDGVFQAAAILHKEQGPTSRVGLKTSGYFFTLEIASMYQQHVLASRRRMEDAFTSMHGGTLVQAREAIAKAVPRAIHVDATPVGSAVVLPHAARGHKRHRSHPTADELAQVAQAPSAILSPSARSAPSPVPAATPAAVTAVEPSSFSPIDDASASLLHEMSSAAAIVQRAEEEAAAHIEQRKLVRRLRERERRKRRKEQLQRESRSEESHRQPAESSSVKQEDHDNLSRTESIDADGACVESVSEDTSEVMDDVASVKIPPMMKPVKAVLVSQTTGTTITTASQRTTPSQLTPPLMSRAASTVHSLASSSQATQSHHPTMGAFTPMFGGGNAFSVHMPTAHRTASLPTAVTPTTPMFNPMSTGVSTMPMMVGSATAPSKLAMPPPIFFPQPTMSPQTNSHEELARQMQAAQSQHDMWAQHQSRVNYQTHIAMAQASMAANAAGTHSAASSPERQQQMQQQMHHHQLLSQPHSQPPFHTLYMPHQHPLPFYQPPPTRIDAFRPADAALPQPTGDAAHFAVPPPGLPAGMHMPPVHYSPFAPHLHAPPMPTMPTMAPMHLGGGGGGGMQPFHTFYPQPAPFMQIGTAR